jgi:hypothetical protein
MNIANILKDCPLGTVLYCTLCGKCTFFKVTDANTIIVLDECGRKIELNINGSWISYNNGECILFPSETQRDWSKFVKPLAKDTPVMVSNDGRSWYLRYYAEDNHVFSDGLNSTNFISKIKFKYVIPVSEFLFDPYSTQIKSNVEKSIV